jgi:hypothetical protein
MVCAHPQTLFSALAVDATFDIEQRIDSFDCFERDRGDRRRLLAAPGIGRKLREPEELPASERPPASIRRLQSNVVTQIPA